MKKTLLIWIMAAMLSVFAFQPGLFAKADHQETIKYVQADSLKNASDTVRQDTVDIYSATRDSLIDETYRYLRSIGAPRDLRAEPMVDSCLVRSFDLTFLLAQGTIETGMGSAGIGKTRNSLFGVYSHRCATKNESVNRYMDLVTRSYLKPPSKNFESLMRRYVSNAGYRYAGDPGYEAKLRTKYEYISRKFSIRRLQRTLEEMRKMN